MGKSLTSPVGLRYPDFKSPLFYFLILLQKHPGGRKPLFLYRNRDATEGSTFANCSCSTFLLIFFFLIKVFEIYHSPEAIKMLDGRLKVAQKKNPDAKPQPKNLQKVSKNLCFSNLPYIFSKEFAELVEEAKKKGLFQANFFYETVKLFWYRTNFFFPAAF
jgi:hypothetical protein